MTDGSISMDTVDSPAPAHEPANGLTSAEVTGLRIQYGFNDIPEEKKHPLLKFLSYFWVTREYYHLDAGVIQMLIFLKLAVAGHMTIYLARTGQQHFWERPFPSVALFGTAEITQVTATSSRSMVSS